MFYICVFASRNESQAFANALRNRGVAATLVSTPKEAMVGCGLSVKVNDNSLSYVNNLLLNFPYKSTFRGVFKVEKYGIKNNVSRVRL